MEYRLEIDCDGNLTCTTEYENGYYTQWTITSVIEVNDIIYFVSL